MTKTRRRPTTQEKLTLGYRVEDMVRLGNPVGRAVAEVATQFEFSLSTIWRCWKALDNIRVADVDVAELRRGVGTALTPRFNYRGYQQGLNETLVAWIEEHVKLYGVGNVSDLYLRVVADFSLTDVYIPSLPKFTQIVRRLDANVK